MSIKEDLKEIERLEKIEKAAFEKSVDNPDNEELESISDKAYAELFKAYEKLGRKISEFSDNKIDIKTAIRMVIHQRKELKRIFS